MKPFRVITGAWDGREIAECPLEDDATLVAKGAAVISSKPHFVARGTRLLWWFDRAGRRHAIDDDGKK